MRIQLFFIAMMFFSSIVAMEPNKDSEKELLSAQTELKLDLVNYDKAFKHLNVAYEQKVNGAKEILIQLNDTFLNQIKLGNYYRVPLSKKVRLLLSIDETDENKYQEAMYLYKFDNQNKIFKRLDKFFNIYKTVKNKETRQKIKNLMLSWGENNVPAQCYYAANWENNHRSVINKIQEACENAEKQKLNMGFLIIMQQASALKKLQLIVNGKGKSKNARKVRQQAQSLLAGLYNDHAYQVQQTKKKQYYFNQANDLYKQLLENPQTALEAAKKLMCNALYGNGKFKQPVKIAYKCALILEKSKKESVYKSLDSKCIAYLEQCVKQRNAEVYEYALYLLASCLHAKEDKKAAQYFYLCKSFDCFKNDLIVKIMAASYSQNLDKNDILDVLNTVNTRYKNERDIYAQKIAHNILLRIVNLDFETLFSGLDDYNQLISQLRKALNNIKDSETQPKIESHLAQLYFQRGKIHKNSGSTKKMISDFCSSFRYDVNNLEVMRTLVQLLCGEHESYINIKSNILVETYLEALLDDNKKVQKDDVSSLVKILGLYLSEKNKKNYEIFETGNSGKANTKFAFDALKLLVRIPVNLQKKDKNLQYFIAANKILGEWYTGKNKFVNENLKEAIRCFENVKRYDITVYPNLVGSYFKNGQSERATACLNELEKRENNKRIDKTEFNKVLMQCNWLKVLEAFKKKNEEEMSKCLKIILEKSVYFKKLNWILDLTPKDVFGQLKKSVEESIGKKTSSEKIDASLAYLLGAVLLDQDNNKSQKLGVKYTMFALEQKVPIIQLICGKRMIKEDNENISLGINCLGNALFQDQDKKVQERALIILKKMPFNILAKYYLAINYYSKGNFNEFLKKINVTAGLKYANEILRKKSKSEKEDLEFIVHALRILLQENPIVYKAFVKASEQNDIGATLILALTHHFQVPAISKEMSLKEEEKLFLQKFKLEFKYKKRLRNLLSEEEKNLVKSFFEDQFKRQLSYFTGKLRGKKKYYSRMEYFYDNQIKIKNLDRKKAIQLEWCNFLKALENEDDKKMLDCLEKISVKSIVFNKESNFILGGGIFNAELINETSLKKWTQRVEDAIKKSSANKVDIILCYYLGAALKCSNSNSMYKKGNEFMEYAHSKDLIIALFYKSLFRIALSVEEEDKVEFSSAISSLGDVLLKDKYKKKQERNPNLQKGAELFLNKMKEKEYFEVLCPLAAYYNLEGKLDEFLKTTDVTQILNCFHKIMIETDKKLLNHFNRENLLKKLRDNNVYKNLIDLSEQGNNTAALLIVLASCMSTSLTKKDKSLYATYVNKLQQQLRGEEKKKFNHFYSLYCNKQGKN